MSAKKSKTPKFRLDVFNEIGSKSAIIMALGEKITHDYRLHELTRGIGSIAISIHAPIVALQRTAAYAVSWLFAMEVKDPWTLIHQERERQEQLHRDYPEKYLVNCSSPVADERRKFRVLIEELGEIAEAIDFLEQQNCLRRRDELKKELVQFAAVAVAWLETPERKGARP